MGKKNQPIIEYPTYSLNNSGVILASSKGSSTPLWNCYLFETICSPVVLFSVTFHKTKRDLKPRIFWDVDKFRTPTTLEVDLAIAITETILGLEPAEVE